MGLNRTVSANDPTVLSPRVTALEGKTVNYPTDVNNLDAVRADLFRQQFMSGVFDYNPTPLVSDGAVAGDGQIRIISNSLYASNNTLNGIVLGRFRSILNGYKIDVNSFKGGTSTISSPQNAIVLPSPPTFGERYDLVFLEAWFPNTGGTLGNMSWRIRTVAGVDFNVRPEGFRVPNTSWGGVTPQGGNSAPLTEPTGTADTTWFNKYFNTASENAANVGVSPSFRDDKGLYVVGDGSTASKTALQTLDGYVYAIPLFKVRRRNNGGYRSDNMAGARDYYNFNTTGTFASAVNVGSSGQISTLTSGDYTSIVVGDTFILSSNNGYALTVLSKDGSNLITVKNVSPNNSPFLGMNSLNWFLKSDRQDGLYSNIIDATDITDLRHQIPVTTNFQGILESGFDSLTRGALTTNLPKTTQRDAYGLVRAPLGLKQELQATRVQGSDGVQRDLVNLLGTEGGFESSVTKLPISTASYVQDSSNKTTGNYGGKFTITSGVNGFVNTPNTLDATKYYVAIVDMKNGTTSACYLKFYNGSANAKINSNITDTSKFTTTYIKVQPSDFVNANLAAFYMVSNGSVGQYFYADGFRIYQIDQATYNLIDVDVNWTGGDNIAAKFPYVDSVPNFVENIAPTDISAWESGSFTNVVGSPSTSTSDSTRLRSVNAVPVVPSISYYFNTATGYDIAVLELNASNNVVRDNSWSKDKLLTMQATTTNVKILLRFSSNAAITANEVPNINPMIENKSTASANPFVPQGRHFIPANYQGINAHLGNNYNTNHYAGFGGDTFSAQRQIFSDAQTSEARTVLVEALMTPQRHITVTQATPGTWAIGSTIKVKSDLGIVMGVVDADTALATILSNTTTTLTLTDVGALAVNDIVQFSDSTGFGDAASYIITAIDTVNKVITVGNTLTANRYTGRPLYEITASTSAPTVTAAGIAGTWTNLGTKEATYTLTAAPTDTAATIKIDYTAVYPAGKGIPYVPTDILSAEVNGERLAASNTVSIKANLLGKVSGNADLVPHKSFRGDSATLVSPSSFSTEQDTSMYSLMSNLDGTTFIKSGNVNTLMSQVMFQFDLIRAVEDKYGEIPNCITVADKVAWIRANITTINCDWNGFGSSVGGNKATFAAWNGSSWVSGTPSTASTVTKITFTISSVSLYVQSDGMVYFLAYADASDGVTASTINTDYVELSITLATAETGYTVLQPDNAFPVMGENILTANQAFPVDTTNGITKVRNTETVEISSLGELKITTIGALIQEGINLPFTARSGVGYAGSIFVKSDIGVQIMFQFSNSVVASQVQITGNGQYQELKLPKFSWASVNGNEGIRIQTVNTTATTFYVKQLKVQEGATSTAWTAGRQKKTTLNFLGKVASSVVENPNKFYAANNTLLTLNPTIQGNFIERVVTTSYNNVSMQDGVLENNFSVTSGQYMQHLYEFDLSYLGLSLKELKAAIRGLTVSWIGYGSGDNAGALTYGASTKMWRPGPSAWDLWNTNTTSSPSTIVNTWTTDSRYITDSQKVYILVHSTYPASATNPSNIYTDYIKLDVTLADYVDYKKCNIVKVRPETKELKLMFPAHSYRYLGASGVGQADVVVLNTRQIPYQGTLPATANIKPLTDTTARAFVTTYGTGKPKLSGSTNISFPTPITTLLPLNTTSKDYDFINDSLINTPASQPYDLLTFSVVAEEMNASASTSYRKFRVGEIANVLGAISGGRGFSSLAVRQYVNFRMINNVSVANKKVLYGLYFLAIDADKNELILVVATVNSATMAIDNGTSAAIDVFKLPGRPILKGV